MPKSNPKRKVPAESTLPNWLGAPALLPGEDIAAYQALEHDMHTALEPSDTFEQICVDDITHHAWIIGRYRRLENGLMRFGAYGGVFRVLTPLVGKEKATALASGWFKQDPTAIAEVEKTLGHAKLDYAVVMAEAGIAQISNLARYDAMAADHERRRAGVVRELERHRASAKAQPIIEADFEDARDPPRRLAEGGNDK